MPRIGLIDYGSGNFGSVWNALRYLDLDVDAVTRPGQLDSVSHIMLPGVGTFGKAMERLEAMDILGDMERQVREKGKPFLGICVGMQVLAGLGMEFGEHAGLGWIPGKVVRMEPASPLPVPHVGWNELETDGNSPLLRGVGPRPTFYFVHSYHFVPDDPRHVTSSCDYGGRMAATVSRDNVHGVQFHPEKSQEDGLRLLRNFSEL